MITSQPKVKPPPIDDLSTAVSRLKDETARLDQRFRKSFEDEKNRQGVLNRKFDELFKAAKEDPDTRPPKKDIDFG